MGDHVAANYIDREHIRLFRSEPGEKFVPAWYRFQRLRDAHPNHGLTLRTMMWTFYKNLTSEGQGMVDTAAGGSICDLTPAELKHMIRGLVSDIKFCYQCESEGHVDANCTDRRQLILFLEICGETID